MRGSREWRILPWLVLRLLHILRLVLLLLLWWCERAWWWLKLYTTCHSWSNSWPNKRLARDKLWLVLLRRLLLLHLLLLHLLLRWFILF
jgi:hypothetical protein